MASHFAGPNHLTGQRVYGILAGGGQLPLEIADSLRGRGAKVHIVAFRNEADADFSKFSVTWVSWGQVGAILRGFNNAQCTDLVIVGRVSRPDLGRLRPDFGLLAALPSALRIVAAGGDDSVLRGVTKFFEGKGFRVVGPGEVAPQLLIEQGVLGKNAPTAQDDAVIAYGLRLLEALSPFDVGQTVVISDELQVEAIEGIEGTDGMLSRVAKQRGVDALSTSGAGANGFLIKAPKRGQDMRVDLPAIGPDTIKNAAEAKLTGLALHAGHVLAADKKALIAEADTHGISVIGVQIVESGASNCTHPHNTTGQTTPKKLGRVKLNRSFLADVMRGAQILNAVQGFATGGGVVVTRGHVLGLETGEGVSALCQRIALRRQWGRGLWNRRRGVVVLRRTSDVTFDVITDIAEAGFAGFAILHAGSTVPLSNELLQTTDAAGLGVCVVNVANLADEAEE
ncbi:MAG: LpxI family protein [Hyphomicrobiaceae bacterium]